MFSSIEQAGRNIVKKSPLLKLCYNWIGLDGWDEAEWCTGGVRYRAPMVLKTPAETDVAA